MIESDSNNVLDYLESILDEKKHKETLELIIIQRRNLAEIKRRQSSGTIDYEEYSRILANINVNIFTIIEEIPDEFFVGSAEKEAQNKTTSAPTIAMGINEGYLYVSGLIRELVELNIKEAETNNSAVHSYLTQKRHVIVNQIVRIVEESKCTVSSREFNTIAEAFHRAGENASAEKYYKKSIMTIDEYTDSAYNKIMVIRSYADFLYRINRPLDGANQYESAVVEKDNDDANLTNGATYQMKFYNEADIGSYNEAIMSYQKAKDYYSRVGNMMMRDYNLRALENVWNSKQMPASYSRP